MRDIIFVLSDQHSGLVTSMNNKIVKTPNLNKLMETSQYFENAYCNNPLCVPSRMSFLSGKNPFETGIFDNDVVLPSNEKTIADKMNEKGYRTVLVGRMHFKGNDQSHGFKERYVGDITTQWWNQKRSDLGAFQGTMQMKGCLKEFGYGNSPVQDYDQAVLEEALKIIKEKDERPLFMVIGFYGPHFPYCVNKEYFDHYFDLNLELGNYSNNCWEEYSSMQMNADQSSLQNLRSAYYGLVEKLDDMIGKIHQEIRKVDQDIIFIYTSDHGEQMGERKLFGKKTCYESSIRIPLFIEDLKKKPCKYEHEVSLLNLHSEICHYVNIECDIPTCINNDRPVQISSLLTNENQSHITQAIIWNRYKYVIFDNEERLFDLKKDMKEENNLILKYPDIAKELKKFILDENLGHQNIQKRQKELIQLKSEYLSNPQEDWIRYKIKKDATIKPQRREYGKI